MLITCAEEYMYKTGERTGALFDAMLRRTLCHELRVILDGLDSGIRNLSAENIKRGHTTQFR